MNTTEGPYLGDGGAADRRALQKHGWRTSALHGLAILFLSISIVMGIVIVAMPGVMSQSLRVYLVCVQSIPACSLLVLLVLPGVRRKPGLVQFFSAMGFAVSFYAFGIATDTIITLYK
jgi:hypothetical protein